MLLPGFVESHIHPTMALVTEGADLQFDSLDQLLASVKKWADAHPDAKVIAASVGATRSFPRLAQPKHLWTNYSPTAPYSSLRSTATADGSTAKPWRWQE